MNDARTRRWSWSSKLEARGADRCAEIEAMKQQVETLKRMVGLLASDAVHGLSGQVRPLAGVAETTTNLSGFSLQGHNISDLWSPKIGESCTSIDKERGAEAAEWWGVDRHKACAASTPSAIPLLETAPTSSDNQTSTNVNFTGSNNLKKELPVEVSDDDKCVDKTFTVQGGTGDKQNDAQALQTPDRAGCIKAPTDSATTVGEDRCRSKDSTVLPTDNHVEDWFVGVAAASNAYHDVETAGNLVRIMKHIRNEAGRWRNQHAAACVELSLSEARVEKLELELASATSQLQETSSLASADLQHYADMARYCQEQETVLRLRTAAVEEREQHVEIRVAAAEGLISENEASKQALQSYREQIFRLKQEASKAQDAADEATAELATSQADFEAKEENLELALRKSTLMVKQLQVELSRVVKMEKAKQLAASTVATATDVVAASAVDIANCSGKASCCNTSDNHWVQGNDKVMAVAGGPCMPLYSCGISTIGMVKCARGAAAEHERRAEMKKEVEAPTAPQRLFPLSLGGSSGIYPTEESLPLQTNDVKGSVTVQQAATSSGAQAAPGENRTGPSISAGQEEGAAGAAGTAAIAVALEQANDLPAIKTASGRLKM